jgi:tripartite-type tricarboxylate transporter receptor subunit TctC
MGRLQRMTGLAVLATAMAAGGSPAAIAAGLDYPVRPLKYTHGSAGGPADLMARAFSDKLSQRIGQPVVVESRPGAGGLVSYQGGISQSDGYTLFNATPATFALPYTLKAFKGSVEQDLTLIAPLVIGRNSIVAHPSLPVKSVDELLAYMRANPGKVNIAINSQYDDMQANVLKTVTGAKFEIIRYAGLAAAQNALLAGDVHVQLVAQTPWAKTMSESGRVRVLAVNGPSRDKVYLPNVPALAEAASPEIRDLAKSILYQPVFIGVSVGGKTPRNIVEFLYGHAREIVKEPDFAKRMRDMGYEVVETLPTLAESAEYVRNGVAEFGRVAKQAGIEPQ